MGKDIEKRLSSENSQRSINQDVNKKISLLSKERLLPSGDINHILDVGDQFNKERQESGKYRLISSIKPVFTNVLFNLTGSYIHNTNNVGSGWEVFNGNEFKDDPFAFYGDPINYQESYIKHLKEINGWFGYFDPEVQSDGICAFYDMEPKRERLLFDNDDNWNMTITYPKSIDSGHTIVNGGLLIIGSTSVEVAKRDMTAFSTLCEHGLSNGDSVRMSGLGGGLDGDYRVMITGLDDGSNKTHYFVLDIDPSVYTFSGVPRMVRVVNGQESSYYFRLFEKVETTEGLTISDNDYDLVKLHMANTIYDDPTYQMILNPDIDVSNLTDNLGRPISEIYYTLVKSNGGGFFSNIKSGIESELVNGVTSNNDLPDIRQIHNGTGSNVELESSVSIGLNQFYGDIVEYNKYEVKEKILGEVSHRFNTTDRDNTTLINVDDNGTNITLNGSRVEGYFYKPHHRIKLRDWSNYVEQGDSSVTGIPSYAEDLGDGRFLWRDFLDIGINDGQEDTINYPFLNGCHYLYQDIILMLKRQDPFNQYGLYYNDTLPRDILGDSITDSFRVNKTDDIC